MAVFVLTWDPDGEGWPDDEYRAEVEAQAAGRGTATQWSTGARKSGMQSDDLVLLLRQRHERGITASGSVTGPIYEDRHWRTGGGKARYVPVEWKHVLPPEDRLPVETLKAVVPAVHWDRLQGSGVLVKPPSDQLVSSMWAAHVQSTPYRAPGEDTAGTFQEGGVTRIEVNKYERDRSARIACIKHHGLSCAVCGFNYQQTYGDLGRDFIHVHHLKEVSRLGPGYQIDPKKDLLPLCANCHSMAHKRRPAVTPRQLRAALHKSGAV